MYAESASCLFGDELKNSEHKCEEKFKNVIDLPQMELTLSISNMDMDKKDQICKKFK